MHFILQICYEVIRDIPVGAELIATPKVPFNLGYNGPHLDDSRSDRETGQCIQYR